MDTVCFPSGFTDLPTEFLEKMPCSALPVNAIRFAGQFGKSVLKSVYRLPACNGYRQQYAEQSRFMRSVVLVVHSLRESLSEVIWL